MKEKSKRISLDVKLRLLKEYYESGCSKYRFCHDHGILESTFSYWLRLFEEKSLSLPSDLSELETQVYMARKRNVSATHEASHVKSDTELLQDEISRLRKALAYSELRNEALNEVLKIGREKYGIDLLKKAGAKQ